MKIDRPAPASSAPRTGSRPHAPGAAASRHDNSFHTSDELRIDVVVGAFPDPDDPPKFDAPDLSAEEAFETAHAVSAWLADHALSIANHNAGRVRTLFAR